MKRIGIITKRSDPNALAATWELLLWLKEQGIAVTVTEETAQIANIPTDMARHMPQESLPREQDLIVVIGGDGTFIAAARAVGEQDVPLLGVNMGRLGFLTEIPMDSMIDAIQDVLAGRFRCEKRLMLTARVMRDEREVHSCRVLNDVVVHKGEMARMIELNAFIDGQFVFSSRADGLIVATPTGSTAYALSVGGPIIHPSLDAILLAPISPHTLSNRPITVPGNGEVSITLVPDNTKHLLTLDGQTAFPLLDDDVILIKKSSRPLTVLHAPNRNYYDLLRYKLRWGELAGT